MAWGGRRCPALTLLAFYESGLAASLPLALGKGYFRRLEGDEKLAVSICSLFSKVGSVRFRDFKYFGL